MPHGYTSANLSSPTISKPFLNLSGFIAISMLRIQSLLLKKYDVQRTNKKEGTFLLSQVARKVPAPDRTYQVSTVIEEIRIILRLRRIGLFSPLGPRGANIFGEMQPKDLKLIQVYESAFLDELETTRNGQKLGLVGVEFNAPLDTI